MLQLFLRLSGSAACCITGVAALLVLFFLTVDPAQTWVAPRLGAALFILAMSGTALVRLQRPLPRADMLFFLGSATLVALGAAGAAHSYLMGRATGDFEYWALMICLILAAQGIITLFHLYLYRNATHK